MIRGKLLLVQNKIAIKYMGNYEWEDLCDYDKSES